MVSLNTRRELYENEGLRAEVFLLTVTHPAIATPIRLSGDNANLISTDPEKWGTVSRGNVYEFALMSYTLPDDRRSAPPTASLTFDNVPGMVPLIRSFTSPPATVDFEVVFADTPNEPHLAWRGLHVVSASFNLASVTLNIQRLFLLGEMFSTIQTNHRFRGLRGITNA